MIDINFTAQGDASVGFETGPGKFDRGVDVAGAAFGVRGTGDNGPGVVGNSNHETGVEGLGRFGVVGRGGNTGVVGEGSVGVRGVAYGRPGNGVEGFGSDDLNGLGAGVVGRGIQRHDGPKRPVDRPDGPGVVGIGGGTHVSSNLNDSEVGGVGVVGLGANGYVELVHGRAHGEPPPGPGVVGIGGRGADYSGQVFFRSPGVVGYSGNSYTPYGKRRLGEMCNVGVYGEADVGVFGQGEKAGVAGAGSQGVGGQFRSVFGPQLSLVPNSPQGVFSASRSFTPRVITGPQLFFPDGEAGDLLALQGNGGRCTLWFCVRSKSEGLLWSQVLLGPAMDEFGAVQP